MSWKNLPLWLKGGIIGSIVYPIIYILLGAFTLVCANSISGRESAAICYPLAIFRLPDRLCRRWFDKLTTNGLDNADLCKEVSTSSRIPSTKKPLTLLLTGVILRVLWHRGGHPGRAAPQKHPSVWRRVKLHRPRQVSWLADNRLTGINSAEIPVRRYPHTVAQPRRIRTAFPFVNLYSASGGPFNC